MDNRDQGVNPSDSFVPPQKKKHISGTTLASLILVAAVDGYLLVRVLISYGMPFREAIASFNTIFISILMQAFPFMLIGLIISSAMHVFISNEAIIKMFPAKRGLGFIAALFAGVFLPVCECAIVPVTTGLVKKGVSLPVAVTFMLAAPIINPIVVVSTLYAFPGSPGVAVMRVFFGLSIALIIGLILFFLQKKYPESFPAKSTGNPPRYNHQNKSCEGSCSCGHLHSYPGKAKSLPEKLEKMLIHVGEDFFNVGKYLIIGAFITCLIQTLIPENVFIKLGGTNIVSILIMMLMAFLFSACSTSDAFIAKSFAARLPMSGIMGFMVYGPMMDMKNILMLFSSFEKRFVIRLALLITAVCFLMLTAFSFIFM